MKKLKIILILFFINSIVNGQEIKILTKIDTIERDNKIEKNIRFRLQITNAQPGNFQVILNQESSTLANNQYSLNAPLSPINSTPSEYEFFITVLPQEEYDSNKVIDISYVIKNNDAQGTERLRNINFHRINVLSKKQTLSNYNYLIYVGTNFDLVDGVQAKNLFFATNLISTPSTKKEVGFYLSLYGNRAITRVDSIYNVVRPKMLIDSFGEKYRIDERSDLIKSIQSDNIGAYFSPMFRIVSSIKNFRFNLSNKVKSTQLYYSPSIEFIWRRIRVESNYINNTLLNPISVSNSSETYNNELFNRQVNSSNVYDVNYGLVGFFMIHENNNLSIRLNMNTGYRTRYAKPNTLLGPTRADVLSSDIDDEYSNTKDMFFSGKVWVTERTTGITLQAEIYNSLKKSNPSYIVTLSKAFDFKSLGTIFKPLSSR